MLPLPVEVVEVSLDCMMQTYLIFLPVLFVIFNLMVQ